VSSFAGRLTTPDMTHNVVGLFRDRHEAGAAVNDLQKAGFAHADISLITKRGEEPAESADAARHEGSGAGTGAALGGAAGLMLAVAALAIPGIGPIIAAGPIAAALAGAGIGAAAGGMLGALSEMGVPESEATYYEDAIRQGGTLVVVRCDDSNLETAHSILDRHDAVEIEPGSAPEMPRDAGLPRHGVKVYKREPGA